MPTPTLDPVADEVERLELALRERARQLRATAQQLTQREGLLRELLREPCLNAPQDRPHEERDARRSAIALAQQRALRAESARAELQFQLDELQARLLEQMQALPASSASTAAAFVAADPNSSLEREAAQRALAAERDGLRSRLAECERAWQSRLLKPSPPEPQPAAVLPPTAPTLPAEPPAWRAAVQRACDLLASSTQTEDHNRIG